MAPGSAPQRLDTWLDVACVFKTRSAAAQACDGGRVEVNGVRGKPHKFVRPGDLVTVTLGAGRHKTVRITATCETSIPKARARVLYDDLTPVPSPEEIETRRFERLSRPVHSGRPDSRQRRSLRKLKGR
jgi:ribosome-associated heat shock protein Hsp15